MHSDDKVLGFLDDLANRSRVIRKRAWDLLKAGGASDLLVQGLSHADPKVRKSCLSILGELGDSSVAAHMIPLLRDEFISVKEQAAIALAELGSTEAIPGIFESLEDIPETASAALARLGAEKELLAAARNSNPNVRRAALNKASLLSPDAKARFLGFILEEGLVEDPDLRIDTLTVLSVGESGNAGHLDLLRSLAKDRRPAIQRAAATALEAMARRPGVLTQEDKTLALAVGCLVKNRSKYPDRSMAACYKNLVELEDPRISDIISSIFVEDSHCEIKKALVPLALQYGHRDLVKTAAAADRETAEAIGQTHSPFALSLLEELAIGGSWGAIEGFVHLQDPRAIEILKGLACNKDSSVSELAATALGKFRDPSIYSTLIDLAKRGSFGAIEGLGHLGDTRAVGSIVRFLRGKDRFRAATAALALGEIKDPKSFQSVAETFSAQVRKRKFEEEFAVALGHAENPRAMDILLTAFGCFKNDVRDMSTIIEAIWNIKKTGVVRSADSPLVFIIVSLFPNMGPLSEIYEEYRCERVPLARQENFWRKVALDQLGTASDARMTAVILQSLRLYVLNMLANSYSQNGAFDHRHHSNAIDTFVLLRSEDLDESHFIDDIVREYARVIVAKNRALELKAWLTGLETEEKRAKRRLSRIRMIHGERRFYSFNGLFLGILKRLS